MVFAFGYYFPGDYKRPINLFVDMIAARFSEIRRSSLPSVPLSLSSVAFVIRQKINGIRISNLVDEGKSYNEIEDNVLIPLSHVS